MLYEAVYIKCWRWYDNIGEETRALSRMKMSVTYLLVVTRMSTHIHYTQGS